MVEGEVAAARPAPKGGCARFREVLADLNEWVERREELTGREREEGYAYVAGMARLAIERAFICADPDYPRFISCINPFSRWGLESVDNLYLSADVLPDTDYLIRGNAGNCVDVVYETLANMVGDDGRSLGEGVGAIDFGTLRTDPAGDYTILVGTGRGDADNFLPSGPAVNTVFLRKTISRWDDVDAGWQTIERVGHSAPPASFDAPGDNDRRWGRAADLLANQVGFLDRFAKGWREASPANSLSPPTTNGSGYVPGQFNAAGHFELSADEGLLISLPPLECRYMSVAVGHLRWFCSFDGGDSPSQLNREQSHLGSDGLYHYVVAAHDPGVPNWLDTKGHTQGFVFCRWQGVAGEDPVAPQLALVGLSELAEHLPPDTPRVEAADRTRLIRQRRLAIDRRYAL